MGSEYKVQCENELEKIIRQIAKRYQPKSMILFGSLARGVIHENSDIDLCIVIDTENKRKLAADMYLQVESEVPFDLIIYTPEEWKKHISNTSSFAYHILKEGRVLNGRLH